MHYTLIHSESQSCAFCSSQALPLTGCRSIPLQVNLAKMVAKQPGPPIELITMTDLFLQRNAVREATAFLLDALQDNKPEHAALQTKVPPPPPPSSSVPCVPLHPLNASRTLTMPSNIS